MTISFSQSIKFKAVGVSSQNIWSAPVTVTTEQLKEISSVTVGTSQESLGTSAIVAKKGDLYFKVTTNVPVEKLVMSFSELNFSEVLTPISAAVVSSNSTTWLIKRPILYTQGPLTIKFKGFYQGEYGVNSDSVSITVN